MRLGLPDLGDDQLCDVVRIRFCYAAGLCDDELERIGEVVVDACSWLIVHVDQAPNERVEDLATVLVSWKIDLKVFGIFV